jgi:mono/diheme cytochrome c family protein
VSVTARLLLAATLAVSLSGCEKLMRDMYRQPKYKDLAASTLFADGGAARPEPPGVVAHSEGVFAGTASGLPSGAEKAQLAAERATAIPHPITRALVERGRERFGIYCVPCHSPVGDGDGLIVRRGFPAPPSYHTDRLRNAPDRHFYDVMTDGYGIMYSYADRVTPQDRWAIVAYIRALQLSQYAAVSQLPPAVRERLPEAAR